MSDTGQGIEQPIIDKIFDPFFTTKEPDKGTGMGLSIIYGIVKDYGGGVTVESEKGKGTTFRVYLPLCEERLSPTDNADTEIPEGHERVLLIDDEDPIVKIGKTMLEKLGYQVTVQTDSFEALKLFQRNPDAFDLIITDQTMPVLTGVDVAKRMLQIRPDMPIILCTGYSSIVNEEVAKSVGIKAFTNKPISKSTISKLIRKVLDED